MTTMINIPTEPRLAADAAVIFGRYGLTVADAMTKILRNVVATGTVPAEIKRERSLDLVIRRGNAAVARMQEQSVLNGNSEMTMDEIDAVIAEVRSERRRNVQNSD